MVQSIASGCCDFLAQCILVRINYLVHFTTGIRFIHLNLRKIYRCWIVWGQNIHVVIIPSLLAIPYLGRSSYHNFMTIFFQSIV
jgi:hypothetical protein